MKPPEDAREKLRQLEEYRKRTDVTLDAMSSRSGEVRYAEIGEHEEAMRDYCDAFDDVAEWLIPLGLEAIHDRGKVDMTEMVYLQAAQDSAIEASLDVLLTKGGIIIDHKARTTTPVPVTPGLRKMYLNAILAELGRNP